MRRLQTDYIDLLQLHMQDRTVPIEETLRAVDELVRSGRVRYLGLSNFTAYRLVEALWAADRRNLNTVVAIQAPWSLVSRDVERELVPAAVHFRLGMLVYSPLARGFLSGKYQQGMPGPAGSRLAEWREDLKELDTAANWRVLDVVRAIAAGRNTTAAAVSLAWVLARRPVASVIVGARTCDQLMENLRAGDLRLTRPEIQQLDDASEPKFGYPYDFIRRFEPW